MQVWFLSYQILSKYLALKLKISHTWGHFLNFSQNFCLCLTQSRIQEITSLLYFLTYSAYPLFVNVKNRKIVLNGMLFTDLEIQTRKPLRHREGQSRPYHPRPVQPQRELRGGHNRRGCHPGLVQLRQRKLISIFDTFLYSSLAGVALTANKFESEVAE